MKEKLTSYDPNFKDSRAGYVLAAVKNASWFTGLISHFAGVAEHEWRHRGDPAIQAAHAFQVIGALGWGLSYVIEGLKTSRDRLDVVTRCVTAGSVLIWAITDAAASNTGATVVKDICLALFGASAALTFIRDCINVKNPQALPERSSGYTEV